jgi:hypothetical protein
MLGMTDSEHAYVYLSDGGHFENLALYEMVRRRCRYIILSDAGEDAEFKFDDLGNALRKIRIDLGVPIEFKEFSICPSIAPDALFVPRDSAGHGSPKYYAIGMIRYSAIDGGDPKEVDGTLLYIKPAMHGDEPPDVRNYAKANVPFPHETTGDQMYSESQFESYRALGEFIIGEIAKEQQIKDMLEDMNRPDGQPGL